MSLGGAHIHLGPHGGLAKADGQAPTEKVGVI